MKFGTKVIHAGIEPDAGTGALNTPIFQTSTFIQSAPGEHKGFQYSRSGNPTRQTLENNLAALENGNFGICFSSGVAAIDAVLKLLNPGDEVISTRDLYGGTYRIFTKIFQRYGITFRFVDMSHPTHVAQAINSKTKLIWIESPTNPLLRIIDIKAICKIAGEKKVLSVVDNTFATPALQQPLELGADLAVHSLTKYLGGHSDVIMGAVVGRDKDLARQLYFIQNTCGAVPGPQDIFLVLRGIKTLQLRMERHCSNAGTIASLLQSHELTQEVFYPGLPQHENHEAARRQMKDFGGMVSLTLKDDSQKAVFRLLRNFKLITLAESLGGVESLCGHPASMSHASIPREEREQMGIKESLVRLSIGIEDIEDLLIDVQQAFERI